MVSEATARSARARKESRGAHTRDDYPQKDAEAAKRNTVVRRGSDGSMEVSEQPIPEIREDLKQLIEEMQ